MERPNPMIWPIAPFYLATGLGRKRRTVTNFRAGVSRQRAFSSRHRQLRALMGKIISDVGRAVMGVR